MWSQVAHSCRWSKTILELTRQEMMFRGGISGSARRCEPHRPEHTRFRVSRRNCVGDTNLCAQTNTRNRETCYDMKGSGKMVRGRAGHTEGQTFTFRSPHNLRVMINFREAKLFFGECDSLRERATDRKRDTEDRDTETETGTETWRKRQWQAVRDRHEQ